MKKWKKTIINKDYTINQTIKNLNQNPFHICIVTNKKNKLIGTITDGDIRRALIKGKNLNSKINSIFNKNPITGNERMNAEEIKSTMIKNTILHLPIINKKKKVINVYSLQNMHNEKIIKNFFIIMAGGKGKRLLPFTKKTPKPMLKIMGKPIIERIIINAKNRGFNDFIIVINYLGKKIQNYLGDGKKLGISIRYVKENSFLGTAGSLSLLNLNSDKSFVVSNGDILSDINYDKLLYFHESNKADFSLAVKSYEMQNPFGVIKTDGERIVDIYEKPIQSSFINAGIYVIKPKTLKYIKKNKYLNITDFIKILKKKNKKILIYHFNEHWVDIGTIKDYQKIKKYNFL